MNYTYDEIIASAYLVFKEDLTTRIISIGLTNLTRDGHKIKRDDLKLKELKDVFEFKDYVYRFVLVCLFQEIKQRRDKDYEERCSGKSYMKLR